MRTRPRSEEEQAQRLELIEAVISLALSGWMVWQVMVPQHRKQELRMRLLLAAQRMTGRCARRAGAASMAAELASGREPDGAYAIPLGLSLLRDRLARAYDQARNISA